MSVWAAAAALPLLVALTVAAARRPLLVLLPAFAVTVPFGSGLAVPGLPASYFSASSLLGALLTLALGVRLLASRRGPTSIPGAVVVWLAFVAVAGATIHWSVDVGDSLASFLGLLAMVALYTTLRLSDVDTVVLRRTEWGLILGGAAVAAYGIYQFSTGSLLVGAADTERFGQDLTDPNHLAASLLLPFALTLDRLLERGRPVRRAALAASTVAIVVTILMTGSRGGALGLLLVFAVMAAVGRARAKTLAAGAVAVAAVAVVLLLTPGLLNDRLTSEGSSGRTDIWRVGVNACSEHCAVGSGLGTFGTVYAETLPGTPGAGAQRGLNMRPHNNLLGAAVETGAAGVALLSLGLVLVAREAVTMPSARRAPALAALLGLYLTGVFLGNLEFKYFWMVLLYVGLARQVRPSPATRAYGSQSVKPNWRPKPAASMGPSSAS